MIKTKNIGLRLGASLIVLVFAVLFGAGGWGGGVSPLARQLGGWWQARDLVVVPAHINKLELREHEGESTTWQVLAEFEYQYQGKTYHSTRINIGGDSRDNIDNYQHDIHAALLAARSQNQNVILWLDPQDPAYAVYDRQVRFKRMLFLIPFAILFPLVSLAGLWLLWAIWFRPQADEADTTTAGSGAAFRAGHVPPSKLELQANKSGAVAIGVFAIIWNLFTVPMSILAITDGGSNARFWALLFPLAGVLLLCWSARLAYLRWRLGESSLLMTQQPYIGIEEMALRLRFTLPLGQRMQHAVTHYALKAKVVCVCEDNRGEDTSSKTLWTLELKTVQVFHGARNVDLSISLPSNLPASGLLGHKKVEVIWKLQIKLLGEDLEFILPVQAGAWSGLQNKRELLADAENYGIYEFPNAMAQPGKQSRRNWWAYVIVIGMLILGAYLMLYDDLPAISEGTPATQSSSMPAASPANIESLAQLQARISAGADINSRDAEGHSLLMQAAEENNLEKVRYLLQQGAQVDLATPVDAEGNGGRSALFAAIGNDAVDIVQALAKAGADLQKPSNKVWTPMHYASYRNAIKSMRYLHEQGLPIDAAFAGARGSTPLMIAAQYNQLPAIAFLLQAGADRSKKDLYGEDACGYARFFKQAQAAKVLGCR
ncbi:ankyrin repeat domain-containing protein [Undibacterium sp. Di27W]|uniref:ankyrin repeat domain-containing protein n=1 Tax=Undibacterium sp. Di27W TaxID=3413036 RepID=UPI003BF28AD3